MIRRLLLTPSRTVCLTLGLLAGLGLALYGAMRHFGSLPRSGVPDPGNGRETSARPVDLEAVRPQAVAFCGDCHAVPPAESFPRDAWYAEVEQGYNFYYESQRTDLVPPPMSEVVAYYRALAPEKLTLPSAPGSVGSGGIRFRRQSVPLPTPAHAPAVSHLNWQPAADGLSGSLLFCDMRSGDVRQIVFPPAGDGRSLAAEPLGRLAHPAHVEPVDLLGDGRPGYVVAELGSFLPADHADGKVVWLRPDAAGGLEPVVLQDGLGRVADVQAADFTGDGRLDLVVAEFGWRKSGRVLLLERDGLEGGVPTFKTHVLDERHGAIHVPVADLDGDGRPDFVALISQEHEVIEAFLNRGDGRFERRRIFDAGDPAFGSSGIQLVDLNGNGRLDVLYTNGDSLDAHDLKPYHAVYWLENQGGFPFIHHELARVPGAFRALAGDVNGSGRLDVVVCAHVPSHFQGKYDDIELDTLLWLEQQADGRFVRHSLERDETGQVALAVGDFNGNGRLDLVTGRYLPARPSDAWLTLWWNEGIDGDARGPE